MQIIRDKIRLSQNSCYLFTKLDPILSRLRKFRIDYAGKTAVIHDPGPAVPDLVRVARTPTQPGGSQHGSRARRCSSGAPYSQFTIKPDHFVHEL